MTYSKEMAHRAAFTVSMEMVWVVLKPYSLATRRHHKETHGFITRASLAQG